MIAKRTTIRHEDAPRIGIERGDGAEVLRSDLPRLG